MAKKDDKDLITTIRERFQVMKDSDDKNRREAMENMKFVNKPGHQWDENMKKERGERPCYEFNKVRVTAKRIINDMRANRPAGKVRGVEGGDTDVAEIYDGLIRNIWNISDGDTVVDYAAEYQVSAGMGAWRINTDYSSDSAFDQDILIEEIPNPFCLFSDPSAKDILKKDARDWILTEKISRAAYEKKYPNAEVVNFEDHEFDDDEEWSDEEEVRLAEYWWKEPYKKEIWLLTDGKVVEADTDEAQAIPKEAIAKTREVDCNKVMMVIASGDAILEGPTEWAGKHFPFVQVFGEYMVIDGKTQWCGIAQFAKDAQRSYNVSRTAITETIAQAPQAKWWATPKMAEGHVDAWAEAHQKNFPFLLANPDPKMGGFPQRMGGADVPVALIQESQLASEEIKAVTGIFDDDLGSSSRSQSGRAILARQSQGAIATFNYQDNIAKGIRRTWEILIDLIPQIYDTEREIRVLGADGAEDYKRINTFVAGPTGQPIKVNDLSVGKYDVTVTVGPNFTTKRQEAAETYQALMQSAPDVFGVAGDLIFKSMDLPYADEIGDRLKAMLPPAIQQMLNEDQQVPPEAQALMQQANEAMQMVEQQMQMVQQEMQRADMAKADAEKVIADVQTEKARFDAHVAKQMAGLAQKDAKITLSGIEMQREEYIQGESDEVEAKKMEANQMMSMQMAEAVQGIQELAARFNEFAVATIEDIKQEKDEKPRIVEVKAVRENGQLKAVPIYE